MTCFSPLKASRAAVPNENGKRPIVFNSKHGLVEGSSLVLPCGQCRGCRSQRSREWGIRCSHEASIHGHNNCFLTLTYDDDHLPADYSVRKEALQLFMRRLRKRFGAGIRFFACGEYGDNTLRPHYHVLLLNFDFPDKVLLCERKGHRVYTSKALRELWPDGLHEIGSVTAASANYVARYCVKKRTGAQASDHYTRFSPVDGSMHRVEPEFANMSRGGRGGLGGIGTPWFEKFGSDAFPSDFVIIDGRKVRPPRFYLRKLEQRAEAAAVEAAASDPSSSVGRVLRSASNRPDVSIKRKRKAAAATPAARANSTPERLRVREYIQSRRDKRLVRVL